MVFILQRVNPEGEPLDRKGDVLANILLVNLGGSVCIADTGVDVVERKLPGFGKVQPSDPSGIGAFLWLANDETNWSVSDLDCTLVQPGKSQSSQAGRQFVLLKHLQTGKRWFVEENLTDE